MMLTQQLEGSEAASAVGAVAHALAVGAVVGQLPGAACARIK